MYTCCRVGVGILIMPAKINYQKGQIIGSHGCEYIRDDGMQNKSRMVVFKCGNCGVEFRACVSAVKCDNTTACGCRHKVMAGERLRSHGLSNHPVYHKWSDIKARCFKKDFHDYDRYGGRGITMCDEWKGDFKAFYDYVTKLPNYDANNLGIHGVTIDRRDNDNGYFPGNIRWVPMSIQALNRSYQAGESGYHWIKWMKKDKRWVANVHVNGKRVYAGSSKEKKEALDKLNDFITKNNLVYYKTQEWRG